MRLTARLGFEAKYLVASAIALYPANRLAAGHHVPGIFTINLSVPMGLIIDQLLLIAGASDEDEFIDEITYIPLR